MQTSQPEYGKGDCLYDLAAGAAQGHSPNAVSVYSERGAEDRLLK
jgi:hypothetical protein